MDRDSLDVGDLSELVPTTETDRGLQVTVTIPSAIQKNLGLEAATSLEQTGQTFLYGILLEAQRLAAGDSDDLGLTITPKHISQAEIVERKRLQAKRDRWGHFQNIINNLGWTGVGAAIGAAIAAVSSDASSDASDLNWLSFCSCFSVLSWCLRAGRDSAPDAFRLPKESEPTERPPPSCR
jgi:hypothetical protein